VSDIVDLTARMRPGAPNRRLVGAPADCIPWDEVGVAAITVTCAAGCGATWIVMRVPSVPLRCPACVPSTPGPIVDEHW
jgi:hypothetical protein